MTPLLPARCPLPLDSVVHSDALIYLISLPDYSVDAIISDPPYNITNLDFEQAIDWSAFWVQARRVIKCKASPVILFSQQPFTTDLIMSNRKGWRYEIIWEKTMPVGFLDANRRPLRCHENIQIFGDGLPKYIPQMETSIVYRAGMRRSGAADHYNKHVRTGRYEDNGSRYPRSVWKYAQRHSSFHNTITLHPTEKPLPLIERLILTYTQVGDVVLDPFAGSGTTLVAARNLGRHYLGCDISAEYVGVARGRLAQPYTLPMFETLAVTA